MAPTWPSRPRDRASRQTGSSGRPPRPSCWLPSSSPRPWTGGAWPMWCAGSTPRRWARSPTSSSTPGWTRRSMPPRPPGAATSGTRGSVYATAETVLAPFVPAARAAAGGPSFAPRHLLGGTHTLYLCAPAHDQRRLRGFFTALTQPGVLVRLRPGHAVTADRSTRPSSSSSTRRHTSRRWPSWTDWPPPALRMGYSWSPSGRTWPRFGARYGARAPTVLNNHRAKLFLPGIADPDTLEYASQLIGDEECEQPSVTWDRRGGHATTSTCTPRRLLPPAELRCLPKGQAVLVYGTLPPARLRLRPWDPMVAAPGDPTVPVVAGGFSDFFWPRCRYRPVTFV